MKLFQYGIFIPALFMITSCSQKPADTEILKQELISADESMSELAGDVGFYQALHEYAADDFVKFNEGALPFIGKKEFAKQFEGKSPAKTLSWKPVKADVSMSGDLGYTWGNWIFKLPDTNYYGVYFTVWKKQPDGKWKMALDGGNSTPAPKIE